MLEYRPICRNPRVRQSTYICTGTDINWRTGPDQAVRRRVTDEVEGLRVRRSVCFLLHPRFACGYEGQVALFPTLRPTLDRTLRRLRFVHPLSRRVELIGWRNRRIVAKMPLGDPD